MEITESIELDTEFKLRWNEFLHMNIRSAKLFLVIYLFFLAFVYTYSEILEIYIGLDLSHDLSLTHGAL